MVDRKVMESWAIPLAALVISMATLVFSAIGLRAKTDKSQIVGIEDRLRLCEEACRRCEEDRVRLTNENVILMRRINQLMDSVGKA